MMKKSLLILTLVMSSEIYAAQICAKSANSFEATECLDKEVKRLRTELNTIYKKVYTQTEAKKELDTAQKSWFNYKDQQCGDFVSVDSGYSPSTMIFNLDCQVTLLKQRIEFLKSL